MGSSLRRTQLLQPLPVEAESALEFFDAPHLLPGMALLVTAVVIAALARVDLRRSDLRLDLPLVPLAVVAAVSALAYARRMAMSTDDVEKTVNLDHYPVQAALGIAIVLLAILIAVSGGWSAARLATGTLVLTVAWMGIESVAYPHLRGSFGSTWGWLAAGWALAFLVAALRRQRVAAGAHP